MKRLLDNEGAIVIALDERAMASIELLA